MPDPVTGLAAAGVGANLFGSSKAADAQESGAQAAADVQRYMYDTSRQDQLPWMNTGTNALAQIASLYGLQGDGSVAGNGTTDPGATTGGQYGYGDYMANRQYQQQQTDRFGADGAYYTPMMSQGEFAASQNDPRSAEIRQMIQGWDSPFAYLMGGGPAGFSASSGGSSDATGGGVGTGVDGFVGTGIQGFYDSPEYNLFYDFGLDEGTQAMDRMAAASGTLLSGRHGKALTEYAGNLANQTYGGYLGALQSMAGVGQSAAGNIGSLGSAAAANIGKANIAAGNARASGYTGMTNAFSSGINDYGTYMGYNAAQNPGVAPVYDSGGFGSDPWGIY